MKINSKLEEMAAILVNTKNWIDRNYYEWEGEK